MRSAVVVGTGAVGARCARQLLSLGVVEGLVVVGRSDRAYAVAESLGEQVRVASLDAALSGGPDLVVLAGSAPHGEVASQALRAEAHVVSTSASAGDVQLLAALDEQAVAAQRSVIIGSGFSPGLSCLLACHAAAQMQEVDDVLVRVYGHGGHSCAEQLSAALCAEAPEVVDHQWTRRPAGTGRRAIWFPEPVGLLDCYRSGTGEALLLRPTFAAAAGIEVRRAASPVDRLRALPGRLGLGPLPRGPRRGGGTEALGALRVEVRGRVDGVPVSRVLGALDRPGLASGAVAAIAAHWAVDGRLRRTGAGGLAELVGDQAGQFLSALAERGVRVAVYSGAGA